MRTPRVLLTCDDESVIGAPFYVMERIEGDVDHERAAGAAGLRGGARPDLRGARRRARRDPRRRLGGVRPRGLRQADGLPRPPAAPLRRPLGAQQDARAAGARRPRRRGSPSTSRESGPATIVHGDYRLGNVMFAPGTPARLNAIFDWELATIGDPLADVGYLVATWAQPRRPARRPISALGGAHARRGLPHPRGAGRALRGGLRALDVRRALVHDARAVEVGGLPRGLLQAAARGHDRGPVLRPARAGRARRRRARVARSRRANERGARRAADRLRRRPDLERVRVLRGLLPRRGARRPTPCATASCEDRGARDLLGELEEGRISNAEFEARFAPMLGVDGARRA